MFAGVGPFAIMAAKNKKPEKVVAIEKNPDAAKYLKQNIDLNKVSDTVEALEGDVADLMPDMSTFDRIIMPLPETADKFLELAMEHTSEEGIINYYRFLRDGNWGILEEEIKVAADRKDCGFDILDKVVCGQRGPGTERVCIDIKIK
jgi:tRNA (guanine37-N1)-methyltransferase